MAIPLAGIALAWQIIDGALARIGTIGSLIKKAQSEGRDVTVAELDALALADDAARDKLVKSIEARRRAESPGS